MSCVHPPPPHSSHLDSYIFRGADVPRASIYIYIYVVVVEEKRLVAEEQAVFRRGRGCRDQVITLMLLGQMKARFGKGMFATFIDFRKAYDRVDRKKLWQCLQDSGFGGRILSFLDP